MKYAKPEVQLLAGAADAIHSTKPGILLESVDPTVDYSAPGYDADE